MKPFNIKKLIIIGAVISVGSVALVASAGHSWGPYHWARTSNPFTLKLGDNVSSAWDSYLSAASSQWSASNVLDTAVVAGKAKGNCRPTAGRVEVCNKTYGSTGWLGLAQIWITGGEHITQGVVKLNDTYFNTPTYNTTGWRSLVMCQEIGHNLGLAHQDEDYNNPPIEPHTCMDYFVPDANELVGPNQHDYDQLDLIYQHLDGSATIKAGNPSGANGIGEVNLDDPSSWGREVSKDAKGHTSLFERDLGQGNKVFTFVIWVE